MPEFAHDVAPSRAVMQEEDSDEDEEGTDSAQLREGEEAWPSQQPKQPDLRPSSIREGEEDEEDDDEDAMMARMLKSKAKVSSGTSGAQPAVDDKDDNEDDIGDEDDKGDEESRSVDDVEEEEGDDEDEDEDEDAMLARLVGGRKQQAMTKQRPVLLTTTKAMNGDTVDPTVPKSVSTIHGGGPAGVGRPNGGQMDEEVEDGDEVEDGQLGSARPIGGKKGRGKAATSPSSGPSSSGQQQKQRAGVAASRDEDSDNDEADGDGSGRRKLSRKEKRKAKATAPPKGGFQDEDGKTCKVCGEHFTSRSQLFKHIEVTGHASLKQ